MTIQVPLTVLRYEIRTKDRMIEVWGHVGDYEVMICLPLNDERIWQLIRQPKKES